MFFGQALREDLNLDNLLKAARAMQLADRQAKAMEDSAAVFIIGQRQRTRPEQTCTGNSKVDGELSKGVFQLWGAIAAPKKGGGPARLIWSGL